MTYLTVDQTKMDFSVKEIKMGVENIANQNAIIRECAKAAKRFVTCRHCIEIIPFAFRSPC